MSRVSAAGVPTLIRTINTPLRSSAAPPIPPAVQLYEPPAKAVLCKPLSSKFWGCDPIPYSRTCVRLHSGVDGRDIYIRQRTGIHDRRTPWLDTRSDTSFMTCMTWTYRLGLLFPRKDKGPQILLVYLSMHCTSSCRSNPPALHPAPAPFAPHPPVATAQSASRAASYSSTRRTKPDWSVTGPFCGILLHVGLAQSDSYTPVHAPHTHTHTHTQPDLLPSQPRRGLCLLVGRVGSSARLPFVAHPLPLLSCTLLQRHLPLWSARPCTLGLAHAQPESLVGWSSTSSYCGSIGVRVADKSWGEMEIETEIEIEEGKGGEAAGRHRGTVRVVRTWRKWKVKESEIEMGDNGTGVRDGGTGSAEARLARAATRLALAKAHAVYVSFGDEIVITRPPVSASSIYSQHPSIPHARHPHDLAGSRTSSIARQALDLLWRTSSARVGDVTVVSMCAWVCGCLRAPFAPRFFARCGGFVFEGGA
ncbi:hypothetical protein DFH06DRAFT_1318739 [Mycena polygramma]|nr:hypothetical protein DFH06DRAFT_1318739 [Mycena polygramma]